MKPVMVAIVVSAARLTASAADGKGYSWACADRGKSTCTLQAVKMSS